MPIAKPDERLGQALLGKYELERWLATGGMGVLYAATNVHTGRRVAVKMLRAKEVVGPLDVQRFLREARAASGLQHPNVVDIYDADVDDDGTPFIVMELLNGKSLGTELRERGPVSAESALAWLLPIMGAVALAHDRGLLHRDLKPDNIFLSIDLHQKVVPTLLDFGLSKRLDELGETRSGVVLGTPHYMAPEQVRDDAEVGPQADVWAMGVMFYLALSGRLPQIASSTTALLVRIANDAPPLLASIAPQVPLRLAASIDRALEQDLGVRHRDMRAFARALLEAAFADGIVLPVAPDALGLPDWPRWLAEQASEQQATRSAAHVPAAQLTAARSVAPAAARGPGTAPVQPTSRPLRVALAVAGATAIAWLAWTLLATSSPQPAPVVTAAPQEQSPAVPAPAPAKRELPAPAATGVNQDVGAPVITPQPAAAAVAPAANRHNAQRPRARAASEAPARAPTTAPDPLRLETKWE